jgi:hypothetical protein
VAAIGLLKAIDRFDPGRRLAFSSFVFPTTVAEIARAAGCTVETVLEARRAVTRSACGLSISLSVTTTACRRSGLAHPPRRDHAPAGRGGSRTRRIHRPRRLGDAGTPPRTREEFRGGEHPVVRRTRDTMTSRAVQTRQQSEFLAQCRARYPAG